MESSPRTASIIVNDLDQRLKNLQNTRVHDNQTLNDLESLLNECSNQLTRVISSSESTLIAILLPSLLRTIISLSKICSEKSDLILSGPYLSQDKLIALITQAKTLYNQIKEFFKSSKINTILTGSTEQRHFCEQLHQICDSIANIDILLTFICHKLIVKLLTGGDDQVQIDDINDDLIISIYQSVLRQMGNISIQHTRDSKESLLLKVNSFSNRLRMNIYFIDVWNLFSNDSSITSMSEYSISNRKS
jgi:hypothetical protein